METRARFILIGLFTIAGFLGMLGFVLWLAKVQLDRTYTQYDILFGTVAGLNPTASVTYNGVDVGTVLTIALDEDDPALVRVRIEVLASTPVRSDTVATLASQGVTGVGFIALEGGSADAPALQITPPDDVPVIRSQRSVVQDLLITAPDLVTEATALIAAVREFVTPENRDAFAGILVNVETATGEIAQLVTEANATLARLDVAIAAGEDVITTDIPALVATTSATMDAFRGFAEGEVPRLSAQLNALVQDASAMIATFNTLARQISSDPGRFLLGTDTPEYRRP
jgi:phospholipid/cholesterol/gamma-HCH transport system substrate-binding protein